MSRTDGKICDKDASKHFKNSANETKSELSIYVLVGPLARVLQRHVLLLFVYILVNFFNLNAVRNESYQNDLMHSRKKIVNIKTKGESIALYLA